MSNNVLNGIMGLCVADALGVPVEFEDRETLRRDPVTNMRSYGTYNQPAGTWSDDTSMTLCLLDSLSRGLNYNDIMTNFLKWFETGEYTPYGEVFDVGNATREAINRYKKGINPLNCGGKEEHDNGNGSLMRIFPVVFYLQSIYGKEITKNEDAMTIIHNVSSLTHAHKRCLIACGIYCSIANEILSNNNLSLSASIFTGIDKAFEYYSKHEEFVDELCYYKRINNKEFAITSIENIKSSGYVVDTLEAAIWCLLNTKNYKDCVLMAVNLGEDTDTVAVVAGGLAGIFYGYDTIPKEWLSVIVKGDYVENLCNTFYMSLYKKGIEKLCSYIPYFETANKESVCKWSEGGKKGENLYAMSYPKYDDTLSEFIQEVYSTNLICQNYLDIINNNGFYDDEKMVKALDTDDLELIKAILTFYIRQERFCDGLWAALKWEITVGSILKGETPEQGAIRELKEETGIEVTDSDLNFVYSYICKNIPSIYKCFVVLINKEKTRIQLQEEETIDYRYLPYSEFKQFIKTDDYVDWVSERFYIHEKLFDKMIIEVRNHKL